MVGSSRLVLKMLWMTRSAKAKNRLDTPAETPRHFNTTEPETGRSKALTRVSNELFPFEQEIEDQVWIREERSRKRVRGWDRSGIGLAGHAKGRSEGIVVRAVGWAEGIRNVLVFLVNIGHIARKRYVACWRVGQILVHCAGSGTGIRMAGEVLTEVDDHSFELLRQLQIRMVRHPGKHVFELCECA